MAELYLVGSDGKKRAAASVECNGCGVTFLKRKDHSTKDAFHYCTIDCHNSSQRAAVRVGEKKYCRCCKTYKNMDDFYKRTTGGSAPRATCKECVNQKRLRAYRNGLTKKTSGAAQKSHLKQKYGLSVAEYDRMFEEQDQKCAICGRPEDLVRYGHINRLSVDHCHASSKVRGLLCTNCNIGLGSFREDASIIEKALEYLKK
jgi:hypothetical protein